MARARDPVAVDVRPATARRWRDVVSLFERPGPRGGTPIPAGCWCQYWLVRGKAYGAGWGDGHRAQLEEQVRSGSQPGLLAYVDGEAVGWCRVGPRTSFDRLESSPSVAAVDDVPVWSLVCLYVHPAAKRRGVASALVEAACDHAAANGAPFLEGYAVPAGHANIDAYTGYLPMFLRAGFEPVREGPRRTIVRRRLRPR